MNLLNMRIKSVATYNIIKCFKIYHWTVYVLPQLFSSSTLNPAEEMDICS